MKYLTLFTILTFISACTDSSKGRFDALGNEAQVSCYSGGQQIYNGTSTGKVAKAKGGAISFMEKKSQKYTEIHADCIVKYN